MSYLIRHGEADYRGPNRLDAPGWGADLAPLTERGIEQIRKAASALKDKTITHIVSSPTTRTLQTALILKEHMPSVSVSVEFSLHEWIPKLDFSWKTLDEVMVLQADFFKCGGEWPEDEEKP